MKRFLFLLLICSPLAILADHLGADQVADPDDMRIDSTEVLAMQPFERLMPDGSVRVYDRKLVIHGDGFLATATGPMVDVDGKTAWGVENPDRKTITVYLPANQAGASEVRVYTSGGREVSVGAQL
ncbi:MAG: hypothetical protein ACYTEP_06700 [Planctomycetota bacterium]|jgi:hypothetical protein